MSGGKLTDDFFFFPCDFLGGEGHFQKVSVVKMQYFIA